MAKILPNATTAELAREVDDFFMRRDRVWRTMERVSTRLRAEGIDYVIVGGMALVLHGYVRVTGDVDLVTTPEGLNVIHEKLVGRGYRPAFEGSRKKLRDTETGVDVEFITTGEFPGDGKPKAVRFPDPKDVAVDRDGLSVISLPKLIELKLASGLSAEHRRLRDLADVQDLIIALKLPRELGDEIDLSVRDEFYRMWDAAQE
ncbi:MAG: nucleotidyltransferase family protein [Acidobacteriota bacterium]|nr:nucleotidyltransferase family protein [Acidobacteriota bacterium]